MISLKELKVDTGHFDNIIEIFEKKVCKCEKDVNPKAVGKLIQLIFDFGFTDYDDWAGKEYDDQREQINNAAIWVNIFFIRLNNVVQEKINKIKMDPIHVQLNENTELIKFLNGVTFTE